MKVNGQQGVPLIVFIMSKYQYEDLGNVTGRRPPVLTPKYDSTC